MGNESEVSIRFNNEIKNQNKLKEYVEQLKTIQAFASALDKKTIADVNVAASNIKNVGAKMNTAFNLLGAREFTRAMQRLVKTMGDFVGKSSDYLENINLFQVAFDGNYKSADRFIKKMSEMYGMDESWLTRTVGIFRQLSNAMNLSAENGERLSTLMTQMSLDISSLYNIDVEKASSTLQSALAGQTKPIRGATGADITQATLQTTLSNIGIDRQVAQLSYAEKRLLIIISLTQQLNESIGDMGRTIESPANQTRVLKEQWERLSRAVGNVFLPIMAKILPYLNAILMVLTEIINMIASLFGFKLEDYDYFAGAADSVLDLEDALGGAASNAKDLKKAMMGLRGFDKLNVIRTPSAGSGGAGGGVGGTGISGDILKAFNKAYDDYQKKLENVRMKATKIRDSIMETLGFHKELNYETGEWEWKYDGLKTTLKNLGNAFLKLNPKTRHFVELIGVLAGSKIISGISKLVTWLGATKLGKAISSLLSPLKSLAKDLLPTAILQLNGFKSNWSNVINGWSQSLTLFDKFKVTLVGAGGIYASTKLIESGFKDLALTGEMTAGSMAKVFGGIAGDAASLSLTLGAYFGTNGAIAGAIIGGIGGIITAYDQWKWASETNMAEIEENKKKYQAISDDYINIIENLENVYKQSSGATEYYQGLAKELETIVDENGKVQSGYEDRAKFITDVLSKALGLEIEYNDGVIKGYKNIKDSIDELIKKKEAMLKLDALEAGYQDAINNIAQAREAESEKYQALITAQDNLNKKLKETADSWGISTEALKEYATTNKTIEEIPELYELAKNKAKEWGMTTADAVGELTRTFNVAANGARRQIEAEKEAQKEWKNSKKTLEGYQQIISDYGVMTQYVYDENYDAMNYYFDHERNLYGKSEKDKQKYWESTKRQNEQYLKDLQRNREIYGDAEYKALETRYNDEIALADNKLTLLKMTSIKKTEELTDEMVDEWINMGNKSVDEFTVEISKLPANVQKEVVDKMADKGKNLSKKLQEGMDSVKLQATAKIDADTSNAKSKLSNLFGANSKFGKMLAKVGIEVPFHFASGGLPPVGQLFIANERGPELVGQIGGQSFVANQNQMMELLDKKIGSKNSAPQIYNIYLDENHKIGTYTLEQLQGMAKTNGKPITII